MNAPIKKEAKRRGITRLCHFTPSRNLVHIATDEVGVLATRALKDYERKCFTPTDLARLDGHEGHISCSIQYPNAWYFERAKERDLLFRDWVVLFISPDYLWRPGTKFCSRNASAGYGIGVSEGEDAFMSLFAPSVVGAYDRTYARTPQRPLSCPTDDQAEVLVPDQIVSSDITGIAVSSRTQAKDELARFKYCNVPKHKFRFVVIPELFDAGALSQSIRTGRLPTETPWAPRR